jgi:hypothetical protein
LLHYREQLALYLGHEELLHERLVAEGHVLWIEPAAAYTHAFEDSVANLCRTVCWYAWCHESARAVLERRGRWERVRRTLLLAATLLVRPLWPLLRLIRRGRGRRVLLANLHAFLLAHYAGTVGRILGLWVGSYRAEQWRLDYDLNIDRRTVS